MPMYTSRPRRWLRWLEGLDVGATLVVSLAAITGVGIIDVVLVKLFDYNFATTVLYLVPVSITAWVGGRKAAQVAALYATSVDALTLFFVKSTSQYWRFSLDTVMQFSVFLFVTYVLVVLHESFLNERTLARIDGLTGVANVRGFQEVAEGELERMRRYGATLTAVYIDIDDFKKVNETLGHSGGDRVLRSVGQALKSTIRSVDFVARIGGDEFVILLPEASGEAANGFLERIRSQLDLATEHAVTFSIGAVTFTQAPDSVDTLLQPADAMMFAAKRAGKNSLVVTEMTFPAATAQAHAQA